MHKLAHLKEEKNYHNHLERTLEQEHQKLKNRQERKYHLEDNRQYIVIIAIIGALLLFTMGISIISTSSTTGTTGYTVQEEDNQNIHFTNETNTTNSSTTPPELP